MLSDKNQPCSECGQTGTGGLFIRGCKTCDECTARKVVGIEPEQHKGGDVDLKKYIISGN